MPINAHSIVVLAVDEPTPTDLPALCAALDRLLSAPWRSEEVHGSRPGRRFEITPLPRETRAALRDAYTAEHWRVVAEGAPRGCPVEDRDKVYYRFVPPRAGSDWSGW